MILAPRGEFANGAIAIKPFRKKVYIGLINNLRLLEGITLQASTDYEKNDIERHLHKGSLSSTSAAMVACDLSDQEESELRERTREPKSPGILKLIFLARISRNKNLEGALQILETLSAQVTFSIYGPITDAAYWASCQERINKMPANISVQYGGMLKHEQVRDMFYEHHLLFLPTLGENYGHVIGEALLAGCPVLISDKTPWRNLEAAGVGADVPLTEPDKFRKWIEKFLAMGNEEYLKWCHRSFEYGLEHLQDQGPMQQNIRMFSEILEFEGTRK
jgi:glycosyltransferase involved in cell wall biosynthesis